jgi:polar amino acid transport system substrate-binding protein
MGMRKVLIPAAVVALAIAAATFGGRGDVAVAAPDAVSCAQADLSLVNDGRLTIGTDNPAYPPWFAGGETKGRPWKLNDPAKGKGFEPAVAYAVAKRLGFTRDRVSWVYSPFAKTIAPGRKSFDFAINQVSYSPERAKALAFSAGYYFVNQSIVGLKGKPIASVRSIAGLRKYKLGAQLGTTSYQYIVRNIKPGPSVAVYDTNDAAVAALRNGQIDGLVVDLPTAFYVTAAQVPNSKVIGQFPSVGTRERFGMVFQRGNTLVSCVNNALAQMKRTGILARIQQIWLAKVTGAPVLK